MQYFTRENQELINSDDPRAARAAFDDADRRALLYREQLKDLQPRLSQSAWRFFERVSLHDGTLLALRIGDDIDKRFPTFRTLIWNRRRLTVELEVLNESETRVYTVRYRGIHDVALTYSRADPWCNGYHNSIEDWLYDELTPVDERILRHEVLFSSGTSLRIEFEKISVKTAVVKGRRGLPPL